MNPIPSQEPPPWMFQVAELMLEERIPFLEAALIVGVAPAPNESAIDARWALEQQRRNIWKEVYRRVARRFYESKADAVGFNKKVVVGQMVADAEALRAMGKPKEALDGNAAIAKVAGHVGAETNINLFSDLSGADIERLRKSLAERASK